MTEEHVFANYIRILGKGKNGARSLTEDEAYRAMKHIYCYEVEPEQLGAFLMLMRVKEETAEEVAGFVRAIKESIAIPKNIPPVAIDWSSYAGKRRQLPWYLLAALALSKQGYPVFMHGMTREDDRIYTSKALQVLGINEAINLQQAASMIEDTGFAYVDILKISPLTSELIEKRRLLGLRPPLHTVVRMINPFSAPLMMQGVFHPNYAETHQLAAKLLGQPAALAIKGEGGEIERIPERGVKLFGYSDGQLWNDEWPNLLSPGKYVPEKFPDWDHYVKVWNGEDEDEYSLHAIIGTIALVLRALGESNDSEYLQTKAKALWTARHEHVQEEQVLARNMV